MKNEGSLKYWLNQLCRNMNEAISASDGINHCIKKIKDRGFELCLFVEATVSVSQDADETPFQRYKKLVTPAEAGKRKRLQLNRKDKACLESLKIKIGKDYPKSSSKRRLNSQR